MINMVGRIFESNNYGKFKVISRTEKRSGRWFYEIEFVETGFKTVTREDKILNGSIKDRSKSKILFGVGYLGEPVVDSKLKRLLYMRWYNMLRRCYYENDKRYSTYGGCGVTIDKRWHCFNVYYNDVLKLDGFDEVKILEGKIVIDKDIKGGRSLIYSNDTCIWVSFEENQNEMNSRRESRSFIAISPDGEILTCENAKKFAREHGIDESVIYKVLNGKRKQTKGWKFSYAKGEE